MSFFKNSEVMVKRLKFLSHNTTFKSNFSSIDYISGKVYYPLGKSLNYPQVQSVSELAMFDDSKFRSQETVFKHVATFHECFCQFFYERYMGKEWKPFFDNIFYGHHICLV